MSAGPGPGPGLGPGPVLALEVVIGRPTAEELAALTAVVQAIAATRGNPQNPGPGPGRGSGRGPGSGSAARQAWPDRAALVRAPLTRGPGAWRRSALPSQ